MVIQLVEGSVEARIVHLLLEMYPVTLGDIARELELRPAVVERAVKGLESRGIVELDLLPDKTFVRLLRMDFAFSGLKESQRKRVKHHGRKPEKPKDYDGPMFG